MDPTFSHEPVEEVTGQGRDVWYRCCLKPFSQSRRQSYKAYFKHRLLRQVGIPVTELHGLHAAFRPSYRRYSPLTGLLFSHNNFIEHLYHRELDPAAHIVYLLFQQLPGGEIHPTHLGRNTGAYLTAGKVGDLLGAFEAIKSTLDRLPTEEAMQTLACTLLQVLTHHPDYRENCSHLQEEARKAKEALRALEKRDQDSQPIRQKIKELEGDTIKVSRHGLKRLQKAMEMASMERRITLRREIDDLLRTIDETEQEVTKLRTQIVTSAEFKQARKALKRAKAAVMLEKQNREELTEALAVSFCAFDIETRTSFRLPKYTTTAVLLAYLAQVRQH
jgi:uncharacterized protein (DUF305 family)